MSSRSARRYQHRRLKRLSAFDTAQQRTEAVRQLVVWQREARRRAPDLNAPEVWDLARNAQRQSVAELLDPGGDLQNDLNRICAQAVAGEAGRSLVQGSRPLADRVRLCRPKSSF